MNEDYEYLNEDYLSECCGAPILGEIVDDIGRCSQCQEWSGISLNPENDPEFDDRNEE